MSKVSGSGESAKSFMSGFAADLEDWNSPRLRAVRLFQEGMEARSRRLTAEGLSAMASEGWNLNTFIIQDTPRSWFNLGSYFLSKGTVHAANLLEDLARRPDVDLNLHRAMTFDSDNKYLLAAARREEIARSQVVKPIGHSFMIGFGQHIGLESTGKGNLDDSRIKICASLLELFKEVGLDWTLVDSRNNTAAHSLFAHGTGDVCLAALPWLIEHGVDLSVVNSDGHTASSLAQHRLLKTTPLTMGRKFQSSLSKYKKALAIAEEHALVSSTGSSLNANLRRAPRL